MAKQQSAATARLCRKWVGRERLDSFRHQQKCPSREKNTSRHRTGSGVGNARTESRISSSKLARAYENFQFRTGAARGAARLLESTRPFPVRSEGSRCAHTRRQVGKPPRLRVRFVIIRGHRWQFENPFCDIPIFITTLLRSCTDERRGI